MAYASNSVELATRFASDFNLDGLVDVGDLHVWQAAQGVNELGDADGDSDLDDFQIANLMIPEPPSAILTLLFMGIEITHRQLRFRRELAC